MAVKVLMVVLLVGCFSISSARHPDNEQAFRDELEAFLEHKNKENSMEKDEVSLDNEDQSSNHRHSNHLAEDEEQEEDEQDDMQLRRAFRTFFQCRKAGDACGGVVPCCGEHKCFWSQGYSMLQEGKCIACVGKNDKCQRNSQCCEEMVCQKEGTLSLNGHCQAKKNAGETCHENKQCKSGDCKISVWKKASLQEGSCV